MDNAIKVILDLCSGTGSWSKPYKEAGYTVIEIEIEKGLDVRLLKYNPEWNVYGILAAPPCTVFSYAGNRWQRTDNDYLNALSIVDACLRAVVIYKPKFWALENPYRKLKWWLGEPRFVFDPYFFGDAYTKKTALWGEFNIPRLKPVFPEEGSKMCNKIRNPKQRAITPEGFAKAFFEVNQ